MIKTLRVCSGYRYNTGVGETFLSEEDNKILLTLFIKIRKKLLTKHHDISHVSIVCSYYPFDSLEGNKPDMFLAVNPIDVIL